MDNVSLKGYFKQNVRCSLTADLQLSQQCPLRAKSGPIKN